MVFSANTSPVIFDQNGVLGHSLLTVDGVEYIQLVLAPGSEVPRHVLPFAIEFFVVAGEGTALLGDGEVAVAGRQLVRIEADEPRGWRNDGTEELVLLGVKHVAEA
jgi:quercetin dioxygenase-like cupin family protein